MFNYDILKAPERANRHLLGTLHPNKGRCVEPSQKVHGMTKNERFLVCLSRILHKSKTYNKKRIWGGRSKRIQANI